MCGSKTTVTSVAGLRLLGAALWVALGAAPVSAERRAAEGVRLEAGCVTLGPAQPFNVLVPRQVCLPAFEVDRTEVTVAAYRACVKAGGCAAPEVTGEGCTYAKDPSGRHPINCVSYREAAGYCAWRGQRLPSLDEWERAARGAKSTTYPWGEEAPTDRLAAKHRHGREGGLLTSPVCSRPRGNSAEGACDLAGNVAEYVAGFWLAEPFSPAAEPVGELPARGARIVRGGSIASGDANLRGWMRDRRPATARPGVGNGFRCARDLAGAAQ